ncbi:hypothetical protein V8G54_033695 [Vigna mungo]|uniref:NAC domain-containing protein n=1 Tax=Vigna mungo TaxID=3915 RepID=A0AAQ3MNV6_VIGMU
MTITEKTSVTDTKLTEEIRTVTCHSWDPGVKFDPSDLEILEYLEAKVGSDARKLHPLIEAFIPTIEGENRIWSTDPEKLPEKWLMILVMEDKLVQREERDGQLVMASEKWLTILPSG